MKINLQRHWDRFAAILVVFLLTMLSTFSFAQIQTNVPALKNVYADDFYIGCLLSYAHIGLPTDPSVPGQSTLVYSNGEGGQLIKFHMNSMSPGNWMKAIYIVDIAVSASAYSAAATQTEKDSIDVHPKVTFNGNIIAQLNWAQRQGFTFRGHTLVWHSQTPGIEFFRSGYTSGGTRLTKQKMTERMENYISEVIRLIHEGWPGLLSAIDVVNEAVNDDGTDRKTYSEYGQTKDDEWYTTFGDNSYIMKAFEFARKHTVQYSETQIKLYYNDYNTSTSSKANGIVRVCGPIFRAGLLDGIGMQEHDAMYSPSADQWIATYNKFDTICTEMAVTEFDISTGSGTNTPSASILVTQANQYGQLFKCFVERSYKSGRGKIISVSKDGLNDEWTFVKNQSSSLWSTQNQCKPAFYAVANVGINYNALDSLIKYADTLVESKYTADSWTNLTAVLTSAKNARDKNYSYVTSADTALGIAKDSMELALNGLIITGVNNKDAQPSNFALYQNYPNPFNPSTQITYSIAQSGHVSLKVYDLLGKEVATLADGYKNAGTLSVNYNAHGLASGIYFYKIQAGKNVAMKKMLLLK